MLRLFGRFEATETVVSAYHSVRAVNRAYYCYKPNHMESGYAGTLFYGACFGLPQAFPIVFEMTGNGNKGQVFRNIAVNRPK